MMSKRLRLTLTVAALVLAPSLVSAGPIGWSYTAHVRTTTGLGVLNLGQQRLFVDPSGNGTGQPVFGDYVVTAPLAESTVSGSFTQDAGRSNDAVRLFSVGHGHSVDPLATAPASDAGFLLSFTLTDQASGESGTVIFRGSVGASTTDEYPPSVLFAGSLSPEVKELRLGNNRYRLTASGGRPDEIQEPATMSMGVVATANTPEPATLAMAGLGLAGVGLFRSRTARRSIPDSGR